VGYVNSLEGRCYFLAPSHPWAFASTETGHPEATGALAQAGKISAWEKLVDSNKNSPNPGEFNGDYRLSETFLLPPVG